MIHGYCRVSTAEQNQDGRTSLADQEKRIRCGTGLLQMDEGEPCIWQEEVSGSVPLADRAVGGRLLAALGSGDIVVAAKLDRMFRSAADALTRLEAFQRAGIDLVLLDYSTEPIMKSTCGKLFFTMLAAFAEFERTRIRDRMYDGRAGKKARGGHIGGEPPFGFRKVGSGRGAMLEPCPEEQATIARARELIGTGISAGKVAAILAQEGCFNRRGPGFQAVQILRWIKRPE